MIDSMTKYQVIATSIAPIRGAVVKPIRIYRLNRAVKLKVEDLFGKNFRASPICQVYFYGRPTPEL